MGPPNSSYIIFAYPQITGAFHGPETTLNFRISITDEYHHDKIDPDKFSERLMNNVFRIVHLRLSCALKFPFHGVKVFDFGPQRSLNPDEQ